MSTDQRLEVARACYRAYERSDRRLIEQCLSPEFRFFSPADVGIDRTQYFERCWPNADSLAAFEFKRLAEIGEHEVLVSYEAARADGRRFCNTEILTFAGTQVVRAEVYFGWNLE